MLKIAVIGTGGIGQTHCRHYQAHPDTELVAVCDIIEDKAKSISEKFGVKGYTSVEDLLANEKLDAVTVAAAGRENGGDHYAPTIQLLKAGIPVLCEKPISNEIEKAREMVAVSKSTGVPLGINLNHRFTPAAEKLKAWQEEGKLGDLLFINMALWINNPNESAPYFHIRALHPHSIDVMRFFGGPIAKVQCFMHKAPTRETWSNLSMNVQFKSGAVGHLTGSYDASMNHPIERCEVAGTGGRGVIDNVYERLEFMPRDSKEKTVVDNGIFGGMGSFDDTFKNRIYRFIEEIRDKKPLTASGADGLAAQEVIEAAIRSHETGTVQEVNG